VVITARAPASTSNLGPGFDSLGAALTVGLEARITDAPASSASGLVERAVEAVTGRAPENAIEVRSDIPVARGLGSSGACVAAGLLLGCALAGREPDPAELLRLGTPLEGHPDNLAAALYGGLTIALAGGGVLRCEPEASVRPFILLPHERLSTAEARGVLPEQVPRADAVANISLASGLVAVLTGAVAPTRSNLFTCTADAIHQPYRAPLMPKTADALKMLRDREIPAAVSGAGPSIVCLVVGGDEDSVRQAAGSLKGWQLMELDWDTTGAHIT
jgi:homoserine kinase